MFRVPTLRLGQSWVEDRPRKRHTDPTHEASSTHRRTDHCRPAGSAGRSNHRRALCRRHGISAATYYKWKQKFGGLEVKDSQRLRLLEEENRKLKKLVADQALDNMVLKELLGKKSILSKAQSATHCHGRKTQNA